MELRFGPTSDARTNHALRTHTTCAEVPHGEVLFFTSAAHLHAAQFTGSFDLVALQEYPNGNERGDTISYYFGENRTAMVVPGRGGDPEFRLVFDPQAATITGLFEMNGRKGGYILPMTEEQWPGMHEASSLANRPPS